jgi:hypothetical protein
LVALTMACGAALAAVASTADATTTPPPASQDKVIIFSTEFQPLSEIDHPTGCIQMPVLAHIVVNLTGKPMTAYAFPSCAGPQIWTVKPGFGVHTAGFGSVKVG